MTGGGLGAQPLDVLRITGVTERALRAVGAWPHNAEVLTDRLMAVLAERAATEPDSVKRSKLQAGLHGFGTMTRDLLVEVAGSAIAKSAGAG
jgi:hypothetical protein